VIQVESVLESLRNGITKDINGISAAVTACQTVRANLQKIADDFTQHVGTIRAIVERIADELRNRVDDDEEKMITNLAVIRQNGAGRFSKDQQVVLFSLSHLVLIIVIIIVN